MIVAGDLAVVYIKGRPWLLPVVTVNRPGGPS